MRGRYKRITGRVAACLALVASFFALVLPSTVLAATTSTATTTVALTTSGSSGFSLFTHYNVSPIAIGFFLVYGVSFVLHKTGRIRLATHRKVWNVLLAATFLVTGIFGLILTIQLDYHFTIPFNMLFWHVEAGVVMTLISIFHLTWHFNYYRNLLRTGRAKVREARRLEKERDAEERRLAWEAREARRAAARGHQPGPEPTRARMQPQPLGKG